MFLKKSKGITLIALVITIVVLVILGGTVLGLALGENGLITRVFDAKKRAEIAQAKEEIELAIVEEQINAESGTNLGNVFSYENVWNTLRENDPDLVVTQDETEEENEGNYLLTYKKYNFEIDKDGKVKYVGEAENSNSGGGGSQEPQEPQETEFTVTYHKNDGTEATFEQIIQAGSEKTLDTDIFTRGGYSFEGWYSNAETTGDKIEKVNSSTDVYAKWEEVTDLIDLGPTTIGNITYNESYEIWSLGQLYTFRDMVNAQNNPKTFRNCILKLMVNIDTISEGWIPIGYWDGTPDNADGSWNGKVFEGTFDGNNKTVSDVSVTSNSTYKSKGFFGLARYGVIKNLTVQGVAYDEIANIGGIVGAMADGSIINCTNEISIATGLNNNYLYNAHGGIVGEADANLVIDGCVNNAGIFGNKYIGGIIGQAESSIEIKNCSNTGNVCGKTLVGGIAGFMGTGTITNCTSNTGTIEGKGEYEVGKSESLAGGIVGWAGQYAATTIENCTNSSPVTSTYGCIGGVVGALGSQYNKSCILSGCVNNGTITGANELGGIAGWVGEENHDASTVTITNCTNNGNVVGTKSGIGGVIGILAHGTITGCKNQGGSISGANYVGGVLGKTNDTGNATISSCQNTGSVTGTGKYVGGVIGRNDDSSYTYLITKCSNKGIIKGLNYTGGIVGYYPAGTISECYNTNKVESTITSGSDAFVGGICGIGGQTGKIDCSSCYNRGEVKGQIDCVGGILGALYSTTASVNTNYTHTITDTYNQGTITGNHLCVGGIVGYSEKISINKCFNLGAVTSNGYDSDRNSLVGGIIGWAYNTTSIQNSYNRGAIYAVGDGVGGVIGCTRFESGSQTVSISNCYNTGSTTMTASGMSAVAEIAGYGRNMTLSKCYWTGSRSVDGGHEGSYSATNCSQKSSTLFTKAVSNTDSVAYLLNNSSSSGYWSRTGGVNDGYPYLKVFWDTTTWSMDSSKNNDYPYLVNNQP